MLDQLHKKLGSVYKSKQFLFSIIFVGALLRLVEYLHNRSLWEDEARLALNFINRSFSELFQLLDNIQVAPFGFLMTEKLLMQLLGTSEYVLRLFPLICGIISLFLFYKVAVQYLRPNAVPIALGLFTLSHALIFYSAELKQYSSDITICLIIYLGVIYIRSRELNFKRAFIFGLIGAVSIWFSMTSVFILAGVGMTLLLTSLIEKKNKTIRSLFISFVIWIISFAICYGIFFKSNNLGQQRHYFSLMHSFMPFPPSTLKDTGWFIDRTIGMIQFALGHSFRGDLFRAFTNLNSMNEYIRVIAVNVKGIVALIVTVFFLFGSVSMFRENRAKFFLLISPIIFTLIASGLKLYPFEGRLLLFFMPAVFLIIAYGTEKISYKTMNHSIITGVLIFGILFMYPLVSAGYHLAKPRWGIDINPALKYISKHQNEEDVVSFTCSSLFVCEYYEQVYGFNVAGCLTGVEPKGDLFYFLNNLRGQERAWIIFSGYCKRKWFVNNVQQVDDVEDFSLKYLDTAGAVLDSAKFRKGTSVYLYDLRE